MKRIVYIALIFLSGMMHSPNTYATDNTEGKPRILILTDIGNEPDDAQSLIRFLLYANQFDVEGILATTSVHKRGGTEERRIYEILDAYSKVRDNLEKHEQGYPSADFLRQRTQKGFPAYGMEGVGEGKDSPGSEWIIKVVDKLDPRPVWITVWGGPNCLAQALWKVQTTRSEKEVQKFVEKIRVYTISDQDDSGPWLRRTFKDLFYIVSPGYQDFGGLAYFHSTWCGISGERLYRFPSGANKYIVDNEWVDKNIQNNHGPLGAEYPDIWYIMEGDTPSFLYLINNGLGSPEHPNWGSWGGRYEYYTPHKKPYHNETETRPIWTDAQDWVDVNGVFYISNKATIWRWRDHYQNDLAARMDWTIKGVTECNHPPVVKLSHSNNIEVKSGQEVELDASPSSDPDGQNLQFYWFRYKEADAFVSQFNAYSHKAMLSFKAPHVSKTETMHYIAVVTDTGAPALTRYQRVFVTVNP